MVCCKDISKAIDDDFLEITTVGSIYMRHDEWSTHTIRIYYCPFCGDIFPCEKGKHKFIPVLDNRKSICSYCGVIESDA